MSFVAGRHITGNIIIAQEIIHSMRIKKGRNSWMAIKVDLEKDYDRLCWDFIEDTLSDAGIPSTLSRIIMEYISTTSMQIFGMVTSRMNSFLVEVFDKGALYCLTFWYFIWRGSGILFIKVLLIRLGNQFILGGTVRLFRIFFVDDLFLFTEADVAQAMMIKDVLNTFRSAYRHKVNTHKTNVFFSKNADARIINEIFGVLGFQETSDLGSYLGVSLFHR